MEDPSHITQIVTIFLCIALSLAFGIMSLCQRSRSGDFLWGFLLGPLGLLIVVIKTSSDKISSSLLLKDAKTATIDPAPEPHTKTVDSRKQIILRKGDIWKDPIDEKKPNPTPQTSHSLTVSCPVCSKPFDLLDPSAQTVICPHCSTPLQLQ